MSNQLKLVSDVWISIVTEWLCFPEIGRLEVAICNKECRDEVLAFREQNILKKTLNGVEEHVMGESLVEWLAMRNVAVPEVSFLVNISDSLKDKVFAQLKWENIESLTIHGHRAHWNLYSIKDTPQNLLEVMAKCTSLTSLTFWQVEMKAANEIAAAIGHFPIQFRLRELHLNIRVYFPILAQFEGAQMIESFAETLEVLDFGSGKGFSYSSMRALGKKSGRCVVKDLSVANCGVHSSLWWSIALMMPQLERLNVSGVLTVNPRHIQNMLHRCNKLNSEHILAEDCPLLSHLNLGSLYHVKEHKKNKNINNNALAIAAVAPPWWVRLWQHCAMVFSALISEHQPLGPGLLVIIDSVVLFWGGWKWKIAFLFLLAWNHRATLWQYCKSPQTAWRDWVQRAQYSPKIILLRDIAVVLILFCPVIKTHMSINGLCYLLSWIGTVDMFVRAITPQQYRHKWMMFFGVGLFAFLLIQYFFRLEGGVAKTQEMVGVEAVFVTENDL